MIRHPAAGALLSALLAAACARVPAQQFASLGDFVLENGDVIRDCRIGYRTFGQLDASRSNAVLVTPWAMGTSKELARQIASGKLLDPAGRYLIAVDALGNGVSSSPSNSAQQPGRAFPRFSLRDVVETQYLLLTRVLGVAGLQAVVGVSAGGMQAFDWATAHPEFVERIASVAGSPRSTAADRLRWEAFLGELQRDAGWKRGLRALLRGAPRDALRQFAGDREDFDRQARAIAAHDATASSGGSIERAAAAVRSKMLVVVPARDEVVDPAPALDFARLAGAQVVVLDGRCGHRATVCESAAVRSALARFLDAAPSSALK